MNNDGEGWLDLELDDSDLDDGADGEDVFESLAVAHRESAIAARTAAAEAGQKRPRGGDDGGEVEAERSQQPRREGRAGPADDDIAAAVGALCERTQQPGPTPGFGMDDVLPSLDRADRAAIPQRREVQPLWISDDDDDDDDSLGGLGDRNSGDPHRAGVARLPNLPGPIGRLQRARARHGATSTGRGGSRKANDAALIAALEDEADFESRPWRDAMAALGSHGTAEDTRHKNGKAPPLGPGIASVLAGPGAARKITNLVAVVKRLELDACGNGYSTLKDATGAIGATIHSAVMREEPRLGVGSVLALEKVSTFSPDGRQQYLAITSDNVLQVFPLRAQ